MTNPPSPLVPPAVVEGERDALESLAKCVHDVLLNARGRSGGSVYMINRAVFLKLKEESRRIADQFGTKGRVVDGN